MRFPSSISNRGSESEFRTPGNFSPQVGLWRSWERASMAWKRSSVRSRPGPPILPNPAPVLTSPTTAIQSSECHVQIRTCSGHFPHPELHAPLAQAEFHSADRQSLQAAGLTDLPLTDQGERNARLQEQLSGLRFVRVFTSPLQRATRTLISSKSAPLDESVMLNAVI